MSWLDLSSVEASENSFEPLTAGKYLVQVQEATIQTTKAGTGEYLKCQFKVVGAGAGAGRVLFQNFNIKNPNAKAVEIGMQQLKNFMSSAGCKTFKLETPKNLEGLSAVAKVVVEESEQYGAQNKITYFEPYVETSAQVRGATTKTTTPDLNRLLF